MQTKNQTTVTRKIICAMMLLSAFFSAFGVSNSPVVSAQEKILNTQMDEEYYATFEDAVEAGLIEYEAATDLAFTLQIKTSVADDIYGYANVQPNREEVPVEEQEEFNFLLLAKNTADGWYAIAPEIVPNETYNNLLLSFPDTLLDEFDKGYYYQYDIAELAAQAVSGHKLPWENGRTAILMRRDGTDHETQLDFDISAQAGTWHSNAGYVYASKPGTVVYVKEVSSNPSASGCVNWRTANVVVIRHSSSEYSWYYHLAYDSVIVNEGDTVNYGTRIAQEGRTGCTSGPTGIHLHYMVSTSVPTFPSRTDPNVAPWPPSGSITTVDFQEVAWSSLANGTTYTSQNTAGGGGSSCGNYSHNGIVLFDGQQCTGSTLSYSNSTSLISLPSQSWNDRARSIHVGPGWSVKTFQHDPPGDGASRCINGSMWDLSVDYFDNSSVNMDREISSIQVFNNTSCSGGGGSSGNWNVKYFNGHDHWWDNNNFNNQMCEQNFSSTGIDRNYGSGAPCNNGVSDNWVAEYNGTINFSSGSYVFYAQNDDGLKIWVNGTNIMERGGSSGYYPRCPAINLNGNVPIRAILREEGGDARVKIAWSTDTSVCIPPGSFDKSVPSNGTTGVSTSPTITWGTSSNANSYHYCIDTSNNNNCDTGWQNNGTSTSKGLSGLTAGTTYYWQARSNNEGGEVFANNGTWWSFTTQGNSTTDSYEPDGSAGQSKTILSGSTQSHSIIPANDVDWVKFTLNEASAVTIQTAGSTNSDTRIWLYNSALTEIEFDDDDGTDYYSLIDRLCNADALPSGTYYVKVDEYYNDNEIPTYNISLSTSSCQTSTNTITIRSSGSQDGWILESTETSNSGGSLNNTATTLILGDNASDRQYRVILHFDTSALPDNAVITSAVLKLRQQGISGTNPFAILNALRADMRRPDFGAPSLQLTDFAASAARNNAAVFNPTPVNNWYSGRLTSAGMAYIHRTGTTQFKLYFSKDDNDDRGIDIIKFFSGDAKASIRPRLVITYYVP